MALQSQSLSRLIWPVAMLVYGPLNIQSCKTPSGKKDFSDVLALADQNLPLSAAKITSEAQFNGMSTAGDGLVTGGRATKFLVDNSNPAAKKVYFINANFREPNQPNVPDYAKYHYLFGQRQAGVTDDNETFNQETYFRPTAADPRAKRYYAGTIQTYKVGTPARMVYGFQFYPQDVIKEADIVGVLKAVKTVFLVPNAKLAFVATGSQQTTTASATVTGLRTAGFDNLSIDKILAGVNFLPMNVGDAWGILRIFPDPDTLAPTHIAVFNDLPLDLTVVAGCITKAVQDNSSHINLKSKERGTPNMVLRDAGPTNSQLRDFADKPVHLKVTPDGFTIEATTEAVVQEKYNARFVGRPWQPLETLPETRVLSFDDMCPANAADCLNTANLNASKKFGSKAANLGFLSNRKVLGRASQPGSMSASAGFGYDLSPRGFGIPMQFYSNLVNLPANSALKNAIAELVTREKSGTMTGGERLQAALAVRELIYNAKIPLADIAAVRASIVQNMPAGVTKIKFRSSANAEDVPNFDGAGLHDSYSVHPAEVENPDGSCKLVVDLASGDSAVKGKMKPKSVGCGMKGVYASLWNKRAIEERSFARIDHGSVAMGVAAVPSYDTEAAVAANSVVVTRVINSGGVYGYTLSIQKDNNTVTNPDPGTFSEVAIAAFLSKEIPSYTFTRFAKPTATGSVLTAPVLSGPAMLQMVDISRSVEVAYCKAKPGYYPTAPCQFSVSDTKKPKALDFEFKYLADKRWICKQVREFSGH